MTPQACKALVESCLAKGIAGFRQKPRRGRPGIRGTYNAKRKAKRKAWMDAGLTYYGKPRKLKKRTEIAHLQGREKINAYKRLYYKENADRINRRRRKKRL